MRDIYKLSSELLSDLLLRARNQISIGVGSEIPCSIIAAPSKYMGLGNRVKCIVSAMSMADHFKVPFSIHWPLHRRKMPHSFVDLFEPLPEVSTPRGIRYSSWQLWSQDQGVTVDSRGEVKKTRPDYFLDFLYESTPKLLANDYRQKYFSRIRPRSRYRDIADEIFCHGFHGIHFRDAPDWARSGRVVGRDTLFGYMTQQRNDSFFYLSTHDARAAKLAQELFPKRVCSLRIPDHFSKNVSRAIASLSEVEMGLVDLLILSRCHRVSVSYGSAFGELVWWFGDAAKSPHILGSASRWRRPSRFTRFHDRVRSLLP